MRAVFATLRCMNVERIDERALRKQGHGSSFVAFVHEGGDSAGEDVSWSVDSLLLTHTDLPRVLAWLGATG